MFETLLITFFIASCISNGLYFIWVGILLMFPPILHYNEEKYSEDMDIHFFLVVPCLNEEKVIGTTIENLLALNMPRTKVLVINDGSTDGTAEILDSIKDDNLIVLTRVPPNAKQGKGRALNEAYHQIKEIVQDRNPDISKVDLGINEAVRNIVEIADKQGLDHSKIVIGVLDADTYIKRSLLERVAVIMNSEPKAGMVQTRVRIGTSTRDYILPFMQDIEFFSYINQMQNVREYVGTVAAAGNGQFNRLSAMEQMGEEPWSQCLLEDFDFSLRLLLNGWRTRLLQDENVYQQGVISYRKFIRQRARWVQGCLQSITHLREIIKSKFLSLSGKIEVIYFLLLPWVGLLSTSVLTFSWFLILYTYYYNAEELFAIISSYSDFELTALLIVLLTVIYLPGIIFSISYKKDSQESWFRCICAGLLIPIYPMMQIPAILLAMSRQAVGKKGWVKTERV